MQPYMQKTLALTIASAVAFKLFVFGLQYPLAFRVSGDAYTYLKIADGFDGFASIFAFAGERTVGFPAFEYAVHQLLTIFSPTVFVLAWINVIGFMLLALHMGATWVFASWARKIELIKSDILRYVLFIYLSTYPALIGHVSTPLTDTVTVDLIMLTVVSFEQALRVKKIYSCLLFSIVASMCCGLSILFRPASLVGVGVALIACGSISLFGTRRSQIAIGTVVVGCLIVLTPFLENCKEKYGQLCLQSPKAVDVYLSVQEGLRGARILWSKQPDSGGKFPMVSDTIMLENFYRQCQITSIVGLNDESFTGCLLARPLALPAFVVKKWIGLFDHFRFTPYLENLTPTWLSILSRSYDSLAWVGLALSFLSIGRIRHESVKSNLMGMLINQTSIAFLLSYSITMLAQHTALHTEERYGFPLLPLCAVTAFIYVEQSVETYRTYGWLRLVPLLGFCLLALAVFIVQISAWDELGSSMIRRQ